MSGGKNHPQVEELLNGNSSVAQELYDTLLPKIIAFIQKNHGCEADAYEIFHQVLLRVYDRGLNGGVDFNTSLQGYLYGACRIAWYKEIQIRKRNINYSEFHKVDYEQSNQLEHDVVEQERWDAFESAFEMLSENCRNVLRDYFTNMSFEQMLIKYNYASKNTAFQRVFKCKKKLKSLIKSHPNYETLCKKHNLDALG